MSGWHLTPEYILDHWTDEKLSLMIEKLVERKERKPIPLDKGMGESFADRSTSIETLSAMSSGMIKVEKK